MSPGAAGHAVHRGERLLVVGLAEPPGGDEAVHGLPYGDRLLDVGRTAGGYGVDDPGLDVPGVQPVRRHERLEPERAAGAERGREVERGVPAEEGMIQVHVTILTGDTEVCKGRRRAWGT